MNRYQRRINNDIMNTKMSSVTTRANSVKEKSSDTPSAQKNTTNRNIVKDNPTLEESPKFEDLNIEGLSSEEKLNFVYKHVAELTFYARERAKDIASLKAENVEQGRKIQTLEQKIETLEQKTDNAENNNKIRSLEQKIESLEQYTRRDDVIVSGFRPNELSYSRVVAESTSDEKNDTAPTNVQVALEDQLIDFLNKNDIPLRKSDVSACHTLGPRVKGKPQAVVLRLVSRKTKTMLLTKARNLRDSKSQGRVYINEHLSKKTSEIARAARQLRKEAKIVSTWTRNCSVFIKVQDGVNEKVMKIQDIAELHQFD